MNKKGAEKILSVYWFIILILVAGGIYGMIYMFYSHPFDIREIEVNALTNKVADCISSKGRINEGVFNESGFLDKNFEDNFLDSCKINFNVEDEHGWEDRQQYFFRVRFFTIGDLNNPFSEFSNGESLWLKDCQEIAKGTALEASSKCAEKRFYSVDGNKQILVDILSAVRKFEKNVKQ